MTMRRFLEKLRKATSSQVRPIEVAWEKSFERSGICSSCVFRTLLLNRVWLEELNLCTTQIHDKP